jgi:hypothetical protein
MPCKGAIIAGRRRQPQGIDPDSSAIAPITKAHRKGERGKGKAAKLQRAQRQAKKSNNNWINFDFLCENFASFAPLR